MTEALPFGEIRPGARPIGAFVNPGSFQLANVERPELLSQPKGMTTVQTAGVGNVQGFNQFAQLADALAPFSRSLMDVAETGIKSYVKGQIEEGYYAELKNQQARATMNLQAQQEEGAAAAAQTIGALQKVDPVAGQLMKVANPWQDIGRRRAAAQLAGADIDNVLDDDITKNGGYLAQLQPGSKDLMERKATLTRGVLNRYGLSEDDPETQFYVTPRLNQAWDSYTDKHSRLHSSAVYQQTVMNTSALAVAGIQDAAQNGFKMPDGTTLQPGTPEWLAEGHRRLTGLLDGQLRLLPPDDKAKVMATLRGDLMAFSGAPYVWDLITGIRVGDSSIPYDKRPTWGAAQAGELLEDRQKALSRRLQESNDQQSFLKQDAMQAWTAGPGRFPPGSPEATEAALQFRKDWAAKGLLDVDGFISSRITDREKLQAQLFPSDPREAQNFSTAIAALPANVWTDDPNALKNAQDKAWEIASREPTPEARNKRYAELVQEIEKAREQSTKAAKDVVPGAKSATLEDLDSPEVRAIRKKQGKGSGGGLGAAIFEAASRGSSATQAVGAAGDPKLTAAANQLERLYQASMQNKINAWQAAHPTQALSPEARLNLIAEAKQEVRKSEQYGQIMSGLLGRAPAGTPQASINQTLQGGRYAPPGMQGSSQPLRGVSVQNLPNLPDSTVKGYGIRPVLDGAAMRSELQRVGRGQAPSPQMQELARRAGISPYRYLQEQLKFYPNIDDADGSLRQMLQEKAGAQRVGDSISRAQLPGVMPSTGSGGFAMLPTGYNPLAAGGWLMSMIAPPAQALQSLAGSVFSGVTTAPADLRSFEPVLALLRSGEGSWDSANRGTAGDTPGGVRGLSRMTLGQWKGLQSQGYNALGAYQFIPRTLQLAAREAGISDSTVMTPEVQGRLAVQLMVGSKRPHLADYMNGKSNNLNAALDDLALEWASVHTARGGTAYQGIGGNAASIPRSRAAQVLQQARTARLGGGATSSTPARVPAGWQSAATVRRASEFGNRESFRRHSHEGADVSLAHGSQLAFSVGGQVLRVYRTNSTARESNGGYGNFMDVRLDNGQVVRMAHLSEIPAGVSNGQRFVPGQTLARSGGRSGAPGSGRSSGDHLHLEEHAAPGMGIEESTRGKLNPARQGGSLNYLIWRS